jgi:hypothetical protein
MRLTEIVSAEALHFPLAFALGFAAAFAWFLRQPEQLKAGVFLLVQTPARIELRERWLTDPEILAFDELYERAAAIVGHSERSL